MDIRTTAPRLPAPAPAFRTSIGLALALALVLASASAAAAAEAVREPAAAAPLDFNRDVRPLLSEYCFQCHGPDKAKRKAKLRLDVEDGGAFRERDGVTPVVRGKPSESELVARILSDDPEERMPPPELEKTLSPEEVARLLRWVEEGAPWEGHWVYEPPRRAAPPAVKDEVVNPVDNFVLRPLEAAGLGLSPEADRRTLIRRLCFDLTGLPPTPAEVDAFLADARPDAYLRLVDRLLGSKRYGERMAAYWLDLVRYADSIGYHSDTPRDVYLYREWVIDAFNENLGFDQFTVEQIAGDLLPGSTVEQKVASGYNRLLQTTEEGGAQPKEYVAIYAADRVRNVSGVWMGGTLGCAQCHDHKFDPYSTVDFYSMAAFFADIQETAVGKQGPGMPVPTGEYGERLQALAEEIDNAARRIETPTPETSAAQAEWERNWDPAAEPLLGPWHWAGPFAAASPKAAFQTAFGPEEDGGTDLSKTFAGGKVKWQRRDDWPDGAAHALPQDANSAHYLHRTITVADAGALGASLGSDDTLTVWLNGEQVLNQEVYRGVAPDQNKVTLNLAEGENHLLIKVSNGGGGAGFYFRAGGSGLPPAVAEALSTPAAGRSAAQQAEVTRHFLATTPLLAEARKRLDGLRKQKADLEKNLPRTLVSVSMAKPRTVRVLPRGNWLDDSGAVVEPAVPAFLGRLQTGDRRANRLDLARWIVSPENPMTARNTANRLWKLFFGAGLSRNVDDLGSQGVPPTHPELLDWLATEFVASGWDVKHLVRLLVSSRTYRQSSYSGRVERERDPLNLALSRQARFRLDAEMVRDNALAISGLLVERIGGRSAKPYQPAGYWRHLNFPARTYTADRGENQYRRALYTHWQRSFLHPSLLAFDATSREECTAERPRSNTPLQALVLLNDPSYVEAARAFAELLLASGGRTTGERIETALLRALSRPPYPFERKLLADLYQRQLARYRADPAAAEALLKVGLRPAAAEGTPAPEAAAWTAVARAVLNLHEVISRQ